MHLHILSYTILGMNALIPEIVTTRGVQICDRAYARDMPGHAESRHTRRIVG